MSCLKNWNGLKENMASELLAKGYVHEEGFSVIKGIYGGWKPIQGRSTQRQSRSPQLRSSICEYDALPEIGMPADII